MDVTALAVRREGSSQQDLLADGCRVEETYQVLVQAFPMCGSVPGEGDKGLQEDSCPGAADTFIPREKIWKGENVLKVCFLNADFIDKWNWKSKGQPMNVNTIIAWANAWQPWKGTGIPRFETTVFAKKADIRVEFTNGNKCWSMVGKESLNVKELEKPTMVLSLNGHTHYIQESLVIHEFGHALGLEHEHQRSDFWDILGKFLDIDEMMKSPRVSGSEASQENGGVNSGSEASQENGGVNSGSEASQENGGVNNSQWFRKNNADGNVALSEYDPQSIMHYKFELSWLKCEDYRTYENIDLDSSLTPKEKKYLKGIHTRCEQEELPRQPSKLDILEVMRAYGAENVITKQHIDKIWKDEGVLKVYFINDKLLIKNDWKYRGQPISIKTIMEWAHTWNLEPIPYFEVTEKRSEAHVRVEFTETEGCWSMVGTDAIKIETDKPTMVLNFKHFTPVQQVSIVVHQFGHALGLEHEHQRSEFWNAVENHLDIERIRRDLKAVGYKAKGGDPPFEADWYKRNHLGVSVNSLSDYDPKSIMHYSFDTKWLKEERLQSCENINSDNNMTAKEKTYLKGIHESQQMTKRPSEKDLERLKTAYECACEHLR